MGASANMLMFVAACTAMLLGVAGVLVYPVLRRASAAAAPDLASAQVAVYRSQLAELKRDLANGVIDQAQFDASREEIERRLAGEMPPAAHAGPAAPPPAVTAAEPARAAPAAAESTTAATPATAVEPAAAPPASAAPRRPASAVWIALALAVLLPLGVWGVYAKLGAPSAIEAAPGASTLPMAMSPSMAPAPGGAMPAVPGAAGAAPQVPTLDKLVDKLEARLRKQTPDDADGWVLLARSYVELKRYPEAADAFEHATKSYDKDAALLADYADAAGMANGRSLKGKPAQIIARAVAADPKNTKALSLAASAAFEEKKYNDAIGWWRKLEAVLPPNSPDAQSVAANIAEAQALAEGRAPPPPAEGNAAAVAAALSAGPAAAPPAASAAATAGTLSGVVRIAPALAAKLKPDATVLVYAKAPSGSPMPIAIMRAQARDLPLAYRLDDGLAMIPDQKLSLHDQVTLVARVTATGNAMAQPGDLQGTRTGVRVGAADVDIVIDGEVR